MRQIGRVDEDGVTSSTKRARASLHLPSLHHRLEAVHHNEGRGRHRYVARLRGYNPQPNCKGLAWWTLKTSRSTPVEKLKSRIGFGWKPTSRCSLWMLNFVGFLRSNERGSSICSPRPRLAETGRTETSGSNQTTVGIPAMETGGILVRGRISLLQSDTPYNATYLAKATA
jgi:hypothetical protein